MEEGGEVALSILPGEYAVTVSPPRNSPLAPKTFQFELSDITAPRPLRLEAKQQRRGRLLDSEGRPVPDVALDFQVNGLRTNEEDARRREQMLTATTDDDGRFSVWIEERAYRVIARPPDASGQPVGIFALDAEDVREGKRLEWRLPAPVLATGSVFGRQPDSLDPAADTRIKAFRTVDGHRTVVGQTKTDADGRFQLVLPATTP